MWIIASSVDTILKMGFKHFLGTYTSLAYIAGVITIPLVRHRGRCFELSLHVSLRFRGFVVYYKWLAGCYQPPELINKDNECQVKGLHLQSARFLYHFISNNGCVRAGYAKNRWFSMA